MIDAGRGAEVDSRRAEETELFAMPGGVERREREAFRLGIQRGAQIGAGGGALEVGQIGVERQRKGVERAIGGGARRAVNAGGGDAIGCDAR